MDQEVYLADEHAECRRSLKTNEIGDVAAEGAKSRMEQSRTEIFLTTTALFFDPFKSRFDHYSSR